VNKYIDQINYNGSDLLIKASDLLSKFNSEHFDLIVANLPYVDRSWNWININNLSHEPEQAIFAEDCGLILIKRLINQAKDKLNDGGLLILEMDPSQISTISCYAIKRGFEIIKNFPKNNVSNLYTLTLKLSPNFSPLK
jgi:release factor glutamine methyltransferase